MKRLLFSSLILGLFFCIYPNARRGVFHPAEAKTILPVSSPAAAPCTCADVPDMVNRRVEVEAAIVRLNSLIAVIGETDMYTQKDYSNVIKPSVQAAVNMVANPNANHGTGETDTTCEIIKNSGATPCLKASVQVHEEHHQSICKREKSTILEDAAKGSTDWKERMTMANFLREDIICYRKEIGFLREQMKLLPANCQPPGWTGNVTYESIEKMAKTEVVPPGPSKDKLGGQTVSDLEIKHSAKFIAVGGGATFVEQTYAMTNTKDGSYQRILDCGGGMVSRNLVTHTISNNLTITAKASGFDKALSFDVSPDGNGVYRISFRAPRVKGGNYKSSSTWSPYPCGQQPKIMPPVSAPFDLDSELSYTIRAKGEKNALVLKGEETIPLPGGVRTIKVSWDLSRPKASNPLVAALTRPAPGRNFLNALTNFSDIE